MCVCARKGGVCEKKGLGSHGGSMKQGQAKVHALILCLCSRPSVCFPSEKRIYTPTHTLTHIFKRLHSGEVRPPGTVVHLHLCIYTYRTFVLGLMKTQKHPVYFSLPGTKLKENFILCLIAFLSRFFFFFFF